MTDISQIPESPDEVPEEDLQSIYGGVELEQNVAAGFDVQRNFRPWHHPVKQVVRVHQWAALTEKLISLGSARGGVLRYFTLPGPDLLDVRVLSDVCTPRGIKIEYFGFDSSGDVVEEGEQVRAPRSSTVESALLQAEKITADAVILPDRLEDIAVQNSHASEQLRQQAPFDVINIDLCDHLAYRSRGRAQSSFDALGALLSHQMDARAPWLLFITTRISPALLGEPGLMFQQCIASNLQVARESFGHALAEAIEADLVVVASAVANTWSNHDSKFLKLYAIGLGKYLLQFFHGQPNHPAKVELASAYAYRVHADEPDMLSLAFRITPDQRRTFGPIVGGAAIIPDLEPERATQVAQRVQKLVDLDEALRNESKLLAEAVTGTESLLRSANYDVAAWKQWLQTLKRRPITLDATMPAA